MKELIEELELNHAIEEAKKGSLLPLLKTAWVKASNAATKRLREMKKAGAQYKVVDPQARKEWPLLGNLGFAWIQISGKNRKFITEFQKLSKGDQVLRFPGGRVYLNKVSRGYHLAFWDLVGGADEQLVDPKTQGQREALEVLKKAGYLKDAHVDTALD